MRVAHNTIWSPLYSSLLYFSYSVDLITAHDPVIIKVLNVIRGTFHKRLYLWMIMVTFWNIKVWWAKSPGISHAPFHGAIPMKKQQMYVLLILISIQLINNRINYWLCNGTQTSYVPSGMRTHDPEYVLTMDHCRQQAP